MDPRIKSAFVKDTLEELFRHSDKLCKASNNTAAIQAIFEIKMRLWSELRNLLNFCYTEEDIVFLLPEEIKTLSTQYSFNELVGYVPPARLNNGKALALKISASIKEQRVLEMLIT